MRYRVIFRAEARAEALEAAKYIREVSGPSTALKWYEGLESVVNALEEMPHRHAFARENGLVAGVELRQVVYGSHRLIFMVQDDVVHVLHVRHASRRDLDEI